MISVVAVESSTILQDQNLAKCPETMKDGLDVKFTAFVLPTLAQKHFAFFTLQNIKVKKMSQAASIYLVK